MNVFSNAAVVLDDRVVTGTLVVEDGRIVGVEPGVTRAGTDCGGDYLIPGIVDLHTDNLERQVLPRSNARWPSRSALLSHDAQCAVAGVTTVFDALCLGDVVDAQRHQTFTDGMRDLRALAASDVLRAEHFLHLRCELPAANLPALLDRAIGQELVRLVSVMDHSPGVGQFADVDAYRRMRRQDGVSEAAITTMINQLIEAQSRHTAPNRAFVLDRARACDMPIASHDDRTVEDITRNHAEGIAIAEFPVTIEAAAAARGCGMSIIAGAPNIVRGGSHSGNVAAIDLIRAGVVDALASDYVPAAMLEAAFACVALGVCDLPAAIALITAGPASMVGLGDRGRLAPGLRADIVRVRLHEDLPVVRGVWRAGERIG